MVGVYQWTLCWRCVSDFRLMSRSSAGWYTTPWAHHKVAACKFRGCESKLDTYYCYTICVPDKGYSTGVCFVALGDPIQFLFLLLPWSAPCCKMLAQQTMHSFEWLPLHHCYKIVLHSFLSFFLRLCCTPFWTAWLLVYEDVCRTLWRKRKKNIQTWAVLASPVPNIYMWPIRDHVSKTITTPPCLISSRLSLASDQTV